MKGQGKGDWTTVVRRSLRDVEEPLPAGGWERLERELGASLSVPVQNRKTSWTKYAAAAASILVFLSIGVQVLRMNHNVMEKGVVTVSEATVGGQNEDAETLKGSASPFYGEVFANNTPHPVLQNGILPSETREPGRRPNAHSDLQPGGVGRGTSLVVAVGEKIGFPALAGLSDATVPPELAMRKITSGKAMLDGSVEKRTRWTDTGTEKTEARLAAEATPALGYGNPDYDGLFAETAPVRKRSTMSLYAAGVLGSSGGSAAGPSSGPINIISGTSLIQSAYPGYSFDHKQPLSFGVSFRKEFKYGLSLETGLSYTLLRSDVAVPGGTKDVRQYLHFIGIPLRANWQFLSAGRFSMYIGAGGMAEKCISAQFGNEKISEKKVQWSLSGLLGAQYRLGRSVGIFFEPSVSHYLTHTSLRTTYTDSSASLDLRLGLRFTY